MDRFVGTTAIVTGAGSGIGRATALRLAREGAHVVVSDLLADRVEATVGAIADLGRAAAVGVAADVAAAGAADELLAAAGGRVQVLVNNAGIMDGFVPVGELEDVLWDRVFAVNVTAPMRLIRAVLPGMIEAGGGTIVNVASEAALRASASGTAYTTSKHAVLGLTRSTAVFYGGKGVRCNAVLPGAVATAIEATPRSEFAMTVVGRHLANIPPVAQPEELAAAICWLASADSANVNGVAMPSDGGWSAI